MLQNTAGPLQRIEFESALKVAHRGFCQKKFPCVPMFPQFFLLCSQSNMSVYHLCLVSTSPTKKNFVEIQLFPRFLKKKLMSLCSDIFPVLFSKSHATPFIPRNALICFRQRSIELVLEDLVFTSSVPLSKLFRMQCLHITAMRILEQFSNDCSK